MNRPLPSDIQCMTCGLNCNFKSGGRINGFECDEQKLIVWPSENHFFRRAVYESIFKEKRCFLPGGVIIVDFSKNNLIYFLNDQWIKKLNETGLSIIILAEKSMLSVANFWKSKHPEIRACILINSDSNTVNEKIKKVLRGTSLNPSRRPCLTEDEMTILQRIIKGESNLKIASDMLCDMRYVYQLQHSLRRKLGGLTRLRELLTRYVPAC